MVRQGFLGGSGGKESAFSPGEPGSILGLGRSPGEGNGYTPVFLPGEFHDLRSLVGYSPWGCRVGHNSASNTLTYMVGWVISSNMMKLSLHRFLVLLAKQLFFSRDRINQKTPKWSLNINLNTKAK